MPLSNFHISLTIAVEVHQNQNQNPHDDASVESSVGLYKAVRLLSIQTAPESFGSTHAREVDFTDVVWYDGLSNPKATTFIPLQAVRIVSYSLYPDFLEISLSRAAEEHAT